MSRSAFCCVLLADADSSPGVHWVRDPHSGVYNFDPYIQTVPEVRDFDFDRLYPYTRSSRDTVRA